MDKLLHVEEMADRLGLKVSTVRQMIYKGDLPSVRPTRKAVRVREEDVEALIRVEYRPGGHQAYRGGGLGKWTKREIVNAGESKLPPSLTQR